VEETYVFRIPIYDTPGKELDSLKAYVSPTFIHPADRSLLNPLPMLLGMTGSRKTHGMFIFGEYGERARK
jgi:hypothetical protein